MPITLPSGLAELLGQIQNGIRTGFQRSHTLGTAFAGRLLWLTNDLDIDVSADFNLKPRPETQRGSATIGAAAHNGNHVAMIDGLKYDENNDGSSRKFLNVIENKQRVELTAALQNNSTAAEIEAIKVKYRVEIMNAVDFWNTLELYPEHLEKMGHTDLLSVAFNRADPRFSNDMSALQVYLNEPDMQRLFDYDYMKAHPYFQEIEQLRGGAEIDIDRALIERYDIQGFIRYPEGDVIWTDEMRAHAFAREMAMGAVTDANDVVDYNKLTQIVENGKFQAVEAEILDGLSRMDETSKLGIKNFKDFGAKYIDLDPERFSASFGKIATLLNDPEIDAFRHAPAHLSGTRTRLFDYASRIGTGPDGKGFISGLNLDARMASAATGALGAALFGWIKYEVAKEKYGEGSAELDAWIEQEALSLALAVPVGAAATWLAGAAGPLGMVTLISAGAYFGYQEVKQLAADARDAYPVGSSEHEFAGTVLDFMQSFEQSVAPFANAFSAVAGEFYNQVLAPKIPTIQFASGEGVAVSLEANTWLIGEDASTIIGLDDSQAGDVLIHRGPGVALGLGGKDYLFGLSAAAAPTGASDLVLDGGDGDDFLAFAFGAGGAAKGGAGDDILIAGGAEAHLHGGSGADLFHIGANTTIHDAETTGDSIWMGLPVFGGSKQWWMEGNKAYWSPFSTLMTAFPVIGSEILATAAFFVDVPTMKFASFQTFEDGSLGINIGYGLGGVAKIEDYQLDLDSGAASGGVVVFEANRAGDASSGFQDPSRDKFTQFINLALKAGFGVGFSGWDPIVLDLDGDGYELTTQRNSGVYFEFDGDGFAEKTGWVRPDDGFLVLDANANGIVDDSTEFFGDETQGGFAELATHDSNSDGVIDASDTVFADLRVWRDLNGDGVTDAGELSSLADLGIASISLAAAAPAEPIDIGGNTIAAEATVTMTDGSTRKAGDAVLDISHIDTKYITSTTVSTAAAALPQLRGFGNVADLHVAMSEDAALLSQVDAFDQLATSDLSVLKQAAEDILYAWAGVDGVAADPIGTNGFDARKLAFLEALSGQEIAPRDPQTGAVSTAGLAELEDSWADTLQSLTLRLVVQSSGLPAFAGMTYRDDLDLIVMGGADTLKDVYATILTGLSTDPAAALNEWADWGELLKAIQQGSRRFDNNIVRDDFVAAQLQAAIMESGTSFDLAALAPAVGIGSLRIGTAASETLTQVDGGTIFSSLGDGDVAVGGTGQDVYLLARGFGAVTIDDEEGAKMGDRIRFVDIDRAEVSAARVGDDLVLTVDATGETVTVLGQFADVVPLSSDVIISNNLGIEEIQFADGAIMELPDIAIAVGEGTSGDDVMQGTMHTDVFQGRAGNDQLMGGDDADLYVFDLGDGADTIREQQTNPLLMAADMVIFGDDIAPEDLVFSRGSDANDLVITIGTGGDSVTIDNQFAYSSLGYNHQWSPNTRVEVFSFRHYGDVYTHKAIQEQLIAAEMSDSDDVTRGFGDDDFFAPSLGNDTLIGLDGNDTYYFGRSFGNDTIDEQAYYIDVNVGLGGLSLEHGADTVVFAPDITLADVSFSRASEAPHLTITLDTGETMTVRNQFDGFQTGLLGSQWFDRIEWFEFGNGTRISWQDVLLDITIGTDGDDSLWGDLYEDTLTGGLGNDYLSGGGYADTYIFNLGDGQDIIDDDNQFILGQGFVSVDTTPDILRFGSGITAADISITYDSNHITLGIGSNGDTVKLHGQNDYYHTGVFGAISNSRIERIEFADGEVWTWQELNQRAIASVTTAGDDVITGFDLEDRFEASAGNDIMRGGESGDTYVFGVGSGSDRIEETVSNANFDDNDIVEFGAGITEADLALTRNGNDLIVALTATGDTLTIANQFQYSAYFIWNDIELFRFADGTEWTGADVRQRLLQSTSGADHLIGFGSADTLDGGAGDDILEGGDGSDLYVFGAGYGNDIIHENVTNANLNDNDRLVFIGLNRSDITFSRNDNDLVITIGATGEAITVEGQFNFSNWFAWQDVETFEFADGTTLSAQAVSAELLGGTSGDDNLVGIFRSDTLDGGAGNDILAGGDGSDIYVFGIGYGIDEIRETVTNANLADDDELRFGPGIVASDLSYARNGNDLIISISGTSDSIKLIDQFKFNAWYTWHDVESFRFEDGSSLTKADIQAQLLMGSSGDDHIYGFKSADRLDGGAGNDILEGLDGSDTYVFGYGYGHDQIIETVTDANLSDNDSVEFGPGITWNDLTFERSGTDLTITLPGGSDTLFIGGALGTAGATNAYTWRDIENFKFEDGTLKTKFDVFCALLEAASTDGDDVIYGFYTNDTMSGGLGNDILRGSRGADTYVYNVGDGHDIAEDYVITWGSSGDRILFGAGISIADIAVTRSISSTADVVLSLVDGSGSITLRNQAL